MTLFINNQIIVNIHAIIEHITLNKKNYKLFMNI